MDPESHEANTEKAPLEKLNANQREREWWLKEVEVLLQLPPLSIKMLVYV
jgi:hypothetical protein